MRALLSRNSCKLFRFFGSYSISAGISRIGCGHVQRAACRLASGASSLVWVRLKGLPKVTDSVDVAQLIELTNTPVHDIVVGFRGNNLGPWFVRVPSSLAQNIGQLSTSTTGSRPLQPEIVASVDTVRDKMPVALGNPGILIRGLHPTATVEDVHAFLAPYVFPATGKAQSRQLFSHLPRVEHSDGDIEALRKIKSRGDQAVPGPWLRRMLNRPDRLRESPLPPDRANYSRVPIPLELPPDDPIEISVLPLRPAGPGASHSVAVVLCNTQTDACRLLQARNNTFLPATIALTEQARQAQLFRQAAQLTSSYRTGKIRLLP